MPAAMGYMGRLRFYLLEWMAQDDGLFAVRTARYHVDRHADHFFDALDVSTCGSWQRFHRLGADGAFGPTWHFFVDRLAQRSVFGADREDVGLLAVDGVAGADLQGFQAVQHVQLG